MRLEELLCRLGSAPLQVVRHDPAFQKVIQTVMCGYHSFAGCTQFLRNVLNPLRAVRMRQPTRDAGRYLLKRIIRRFRLLHRLAPLLKQFGPHGPSHGC